MRQTWNFLVIIICFLNTNFCYSKDNIISIVDYGVDGVEHKNESQNDKYNRYVKIKKAFEVAVETKRDLLFPKGVYDVGNRNFPFRTGEDVLGDELLDCKGITIYGEKGTIFKTTSDYGADVIQLNKVKNLTIKNLEITAVLKNFTKAGSNGISITNGFDNIYLENISIYNLPGVALECDVDGSKGFTIQTSKNNKAFKGKIVAKKIEVKNCAYGFRFDALSISDMLDFEKTMSLDLEIKVKNAFQGISLEFGEATKPLSRKNSAMRIKVNAVLDNCQQYARFSRVFGGVYNISTSKSNANYRYDNTNDKRRFGIVANYIKNASVNIKGNVGTVDTKFLIGAVGSIVEPYGLGNKTENTLFSIDLLGVSTKSDFTLIEYNGESIHNSKINITEKSMTKNQIEKIVIPQKNNNIIKKITKF